MKDDAISRQAIMKEFANFVRESNSSDFARTPTWNDAVSLVESMPTIEPDGRWIYTKKRLARGGYVDASECSVCHKRIMPHLKPNYCPNRGARIGDEEVTE